MVMRMMPMKMGFLCKPPHTLSLWPIERALNSLYTCQAQRATTCMRRTGTPVTGNVPAPTGTNVVDEERNRRLHMQATSNSYIQYRYPPNYRYWDTHNIKIGPVHTCIMTNVLKMNVFKYSFTLLSA